MPPPKEMLIDVDPVEDGLGDAARSPRRSAQPHRRSCSGDQAAGGDPVDALADLEGGGDATADPGPVPGVGASPWPAGELGAGPRRLTPKLVSRSAGPPIASVKSTTSFTGASAVSVKSRPGSSASATVLGSCRGGLSPGAGRCRGESHEQALVVAGRVGLARPRWGRRRLGLEPVAPCPGCPVGRAHLGGQRGAPGCGRRRGCGGRRPGCCGRPPGRSAPWCCLTFGGRAGRARPP